MIKRGVEEAWDLHSRGFHKRAGKFKALRKSSYKPSLVWSLQLTSPALQQTGRTLSPSELHA